MESKPQSIKEKLKPIIDKTNKQPTIVNDASKFVVVTYWWGKGNLNANTARPCMFFYEDIIKKSTKFFLSLINSSVRNKSEDKIAQTIKLIFNSYKKGKNTNAYEQLITRFARSYTNTIYEYCKIDVNIPLEKKDEMALAFLEKLKQPSETSGKSKTPSDYEYRTMDYIKIILRLIIKYAMLMNENQIIKLFIINKSISNLKQEFEKISKNSDYNAEEYENIKQQQKKIELQKKDTNAEIMMNLKKKNTSTRRR